MIYQANPVTVEAHIIISAGAILSNGSMQLALSDGTSIAVDKNMISRHIPNEGDYYVIQNDGYVYINPKDVFLRKYSQINEK